MERAVRGFFGKMAQNYETARALGRQCGLAWEGELEPEIANLDPTECEEALAIFHSVMTESVFDDPQRPQHFRLPATRGAERITIRRNQNKT